MRYHEQPQTASANAGWGASPDARIGRRCRARDPLRFRFLRLPDFKTAPPTPALGRLARGLQRGSRRRRPRCHGSAYSIRRGSDGVGQRQALPSSRRGGVRRQLARTAHHRVPLPQAPARERAAAHRLPCKRRSAGVSGPRASRSHSPSPPRPRNDPPTPCSPVTRDRSNLSIGAKAAPRGHDHRWSAVVASLTV